MLLPTYLRVVTDIDDHLHVRKSVDYFEEKVLNTFTSAGAHWQYHIEGYSRSTLAVPHSSICRSTCSSGVL